MKLPPVLRQIQSFVLVGISATACSVAVALAANRLLGLGPQIANLVGYAASVGISYFGNSRFTFRSPALHGGQFARFATISLAGLLVSQGTVYLFTRCLGWSFTLAQIPVVLIVPASTFLMSKFWAFRTRAA
jgi:putative flippase GtrA